MELRITELLWLEKPTKVIVSISTELSCEVWPMLCVCTNKMGFSSVYSASCDRKRCSGEKCEEISVTSPFINKSDVCTRVYVAKAK